MTGLPHAYGLLKDFHKNTCHLQQRHYGTGDAAWCLVLETWRGKGLPEGQQAWEMEMMRDAFQEGWNVWQLTKYMRGKQDEVDASAGYVWVAYTNIPNGEDEQRLKERMVDYVNGNIEHDPLELLVL
jgi:hypothetical protein